MVTSSRGGDSSSSRSKEKENFASISWKVSQLKMQVQASRSVSIREKILKNRNNLEAITRRFFELSKEKEVARVAAELGNLLSVRLADPLCLLSAWEPDKEIASSQEEIAASASIMFGSSCGRKSLVCLTKLPFVEKIPPYTTWIFLNRNQRMTEDQSVLGRRQIYYDSYGNETLICSDSEEEFVEPEDEKHEFSEGEDWILWKAIQEYGLNQEVLHVLCHSFEVLPEEIQERYEALIGKHINNSESKVEISSEPEIKPLLDKTLNAALDFFDNLFCRRCLIFDCRLHGCSQNLIIVSEKLPYGSDPDENRKPCSKHCYLNRRENKEGLFSAEKDSNQTNKTESASPSEHEDSNCDDDITSVTPSDGLCSDVNRLTIVSSETVGSKARVTVSSCAIERNIPDVPLKNLVNVGKRKNLKHGIFSSGKPQISQKYVGPADKKQKKISLSDTFQASKELDKLYTNITSNPDTKTHGWAANCIQLQHESKEYPFQTQDGHSKNHGADIQDIEIHKRTEVSLLKSLSSSSREQTSGWSLFEKDLYLKGVEIFGKNSCLIARNLLSGLKTCIEVSKYMFNDGASLQTGPLFTSSYLDDIGGCDVAMTEHDMTARTKIWRKRGRAKKLKYTWKSAGHPSIRKRIGDGKPQPCKKYTPCGCWQMCGKQCSCLENGTCCEKYCGCSKSCKNRFRGCHCAKSQCRSRQCPCFAAGRECDPDVCRNCWVSCGDGSIDEPQAAGDSYQCGNMKLLLRQQQRILLARSDVAGWGAFIRNPVNKNEYLGEYTGELVSHKEADKRGKIYDRANSSFLFDLNDQLVLDAYRKGDKLKFANHSSNPNCYAKVMLVAGDHRVGIYAKEHIEAGEELFYDYRYGLDQAPAWARKPEGSKRDDPTHSLCRAKKIALARHELL